MNFFGGPNIDKMARENDRDGLYRSMEHRDPVVRLKAARALAEMSDGAGWRFLTSAVIAEDNASLQEAAASVLGELGMRSTGDARRAVPALGAALKKAHGEAADAIRDALAEIGGEEAETALRQAGYTPTLEEPVEEVSDYEAHFVRPVLPDTVETEYLTAEEHLNTAVDLRESDLFERAFVECSLALWLKPAWAYAWYLRGVLFEDLEREYEAWLAYRRAVELDPALAEAAEALDELEADEFELPSEESFQQALAGAGWQKRRDAAAGLGTLGYASPAQANESAGRIASLLQDDEREVRHAAILSLGQLGSPTAIAPLVEMRESSWLLRYAILEALSRLGSVAGLISVLHREMDRLVDRNPTFTSFRDPLVEVEYGRLLEVGVLALERSGDIESLVEIAEGNAWEEAEDEETWTGEEEEEEFSPEEDLASYVDEVGQMAAAALDRSARPRLAALPPDLLRRLAEVPDLTLIDLSEEEGEKGETGLVYDFSELREAAKAELEKR